MHRHSFKKCYKDFYELSIKSIKWNVTRGFVTIAHLMVSHPNWRSFHQDLVKSLLNCASGEPGFRCKIFWIRVEFCFKKRFLRAMCLEDFFASEFFSPPVR